MATRSPSRDPVHLLAVGALGRDVAERITREIDEAVITRVGDRGSPPAAWPVARLHVLCAWRHVEGLADQIDECAHAWGVPWLPVVVEHPRLRVGPLVIPGAGPCYRCFRLRLAQHDPHASVASALVARYERDPWAGPAGHLPGHALLAAASALRAVYELDGATACAGRVRELNLLTQDTRSASVVGVHGCERCGSGRDERDRSWRALRDDLAGDAA
jgi:bacteriocin biosynthesis cyclodehydratase domain-containing protein